VRRENAIVPSPETSLLPVFLPLPFLPIFPQSKTLRVEVDAQRKHLGLGQFEEKAVGGSSNRSSTSSCDMTALVDILRL